MDTSELKSGDFIRVRTDHTESLNRAGKDAMVIQNSPTGEETVALTFGYNRYNENQNVQCIGPEEWRKDELDFQTLLN